MKSLPSLLALGGALLLVVLAPALAEPTAVVSVPLREGAPSLDGRVQAAEWSGAAKLSQFLAAQGDALAQLDTETTSHG